MTWLRRLFRKLFGVRLDRRPTLLPLMVPWHVVTRDGDRRPVPTRRTGAA
jgi:hypothetical protein